MKQIPLTQGKVAFVDDEDFDRVGRLKWSYDSSNGYAKRRGSIYLHRLIIEGKEIDHINGDKLDNRKKNLRAVSRSQNVMNVGVRRDNSSGYRGVSFYMGRNKYEAYINKKGKRTKLGYFKAPKEAALAYNQAATKLFGEFARLNQIDF